MARLAIEGFEFASVNHWVVDPRRPVDGSFAQNIAGMDGVYCFKPVNSMTLIPVGSQDEVFISMLYRMHTSGYNDYILAFYNASRVVMACLVKTSASYLRFFRGDVGTVVATAASTISNATTYRFGIQYKPHDSAGVFKLFIDGAVAATLDVSGDTADNTNNVAFIGIGTTGASAYGTHHYLDNLVVDDTEIPGETKIRVMRPDGEGNSAQWSGVTGNNFAGDADCVALWRFEAGFQAVDSVGNNTLTADNTPDVETAAGMFKEGLASVKVDRSESERLTIQDANLPSGFPMKSGDTVKKMSVGFWYRPTTVPGVTTYHGLVTKWNWGAQLLGYSILLENGQLRLAWGYGTGTSREDFYPCNISAGRWYHIGCAIDGVAKTAMFRVWDDDAQEATTYEHTFTNELRVSSATFYIGAEAGPANHADGRFDEVFVTADLMTEVEFDEVRQNTYLDAKYASVREIPSNTTDYVHSNTTGQQELFSMSSPPNGIDTVHAVMTRVELLAVGPTTPKNVKLVVRTHDTDYEGSDILAPWMVPGYGIDLRTVNPNTSAAWTSDELAASQVGVKTAA